MEESFSGLEEETFFEELVDPFPIIGKVLMGVGAAGKGVPSRELQVQKSKGGRGKWWREIFQNKIRYHRRENTDCKKLMISLFLSFFRGLKIRGTVTIPLHSVALTV